MIVEFDVMWGGELVASVLIDEDKRKFKIKNFSDNFIKNPMLNLDTYNYLYSFLDSRRYSQGRPNRKSLFPEGIEGDRWKELRYTKGRDYDDLTWFKFKGDKSYWDEEQHKVIDIESN